MRLLRKESIIPPFGVITTGTFTDWRGDIGWRKNGTNDWQILYTLAGNGRFGTARNDLPAKEGDLVLLEPRVPHDYGTVVSFGEPWVVRWVHFLPLKTWLPWLRWTSFSPGVRWVHLQTPELRAAVLERFLAMERHSRSPLKHAALLLQTALQEIILQGDTCNPQTGGTLMDERIRRTIDHLSENLAEPQEIPALAARCHLSRSRFSHLFQKETGKSPRQYLEELRLRHAAQLLRTTTAPVSEIARTVGYEDPLYFSNRFRHFSGSSPRNFRQKPDPPPGTKSRE